MMPAICEVFSISHTSLVVVVSMLKSAFLARTDLAKIVVTSVLNLQGLHAKSILSLEFLNNECMSRFSHRGKMFLNARSICHYRRHHPFKRGAVWRVPVRNQ